MGAKNENDCYVKNIYDTLANYTTYRTTVENIEYISCMTESHEDTQIILEGIGWQTNCLQRNRNRLLEVVQEVSSDIC